MSCFWFSPKSYGSVQNILDLHKDQALGKQLSLSSQVNNKYVLKKKENKQRKKGGNLGVQKKGNKEIKN